MEITRRQMIIGAAALGAMQLIPSLSYEGELEPKCQVFVVGDLHLTRRPKHAQEKAAMLLSSLKALAMGKVGFHLIFNGDVLEFPNLAKTCENGAWQWEEFARLYTSLREIGFIPHLNFGNHDGSEEFARDNLKGLIPDEYIGNSSFALGGTKFILLSGTHPTELDGGFLNSELESGRGRRIIVATHYPPDKLTWRRDKWGKKLSYDIWRKQKIMQMLSIAGASVVCSHSHSPFVGEYASGRLNQNLNVVGTPSVTYTLPYLKTDLKPKRVAGITIVDTRDFLRGTKFFDGKRAFRPGRLSIESKKGKYLPLQPRLRS